MSRPKKRSFAIRGHRTSLSLEEPFWEALREIASGRGLALAALVAEIDEQRSDIGLSTAVRLHILDHYRSASASRTQANHDSAPGHAAPSPVVNEPARQRREYDEPVG